MILYEFCFKRKNQEITSKAYEVKETEKSFICKNKSLDFRCLSRLPKESLSVVREDYWGMYFYALSNDIENAKTAFTDYYRNVVIPKKEEKINKAMQEKASAEAELKLLIGGTL